MRKYHQIDVYIYQCDFEVTNNTSTSRASPGSEFVVANTLAKLKKLEPNAINFSQGFSQKVHVVSTRCFVFKALPP